MSRLLAKLLKPYKASEDEYKVAMILDSPEAIRVMAAWPGIRKKWAKYGGKMPADKALAWQWIWRCLTYDLEALALATRLSQRAAVSTLRVLVAAHAIYPDGTLSEAASKILDGYVQRRIAAKPGAPRGGGRPKGAKDAKPRRERGKDSKRGKGGSGPMAIECPMCGAGIGQRCLMATGTPYHRAYIHAARKAER